MILEYRISGPWLLIIIGLWHLLFNLGLVPITPWQAFINYWPALLIWYGCKNLFKTIARKKTSLATSSSSIGFWLVILLIGSYLLLPRLGFNVITISWNLIWPSLLIIIGLSYLFKEQSSTKINTSDTVKAYRSVIGEFNRGGNGWVAEDTYLEFAAGSVKFDLTRAIIPEQTITLDITGTVGDIVIYLPENLPLKAHCYTAIGDIKVLHEQKSGFENMITLETPDYASATRKVEIISRLKVGSISVRQIG